MLIAVGRNPENGKAYIRLLPEEPAETNAMNKMFSSHKDLLSGFGKHPDTGDVTHLEFQIERQNKC